MIATSIFIALSIFIGLSCGQNEEIRLMNTLLEKYPQYGGRPVQNNSDVLHVNTKLSLLHIHNLDKINKVFTITAWLMTDWQDSMLKWKPEDFDGIQYVLIDVNKIWRPDIALFNSLEKPEKLFDVMAHVTSDGTVLTVEPYKYSSSCPSVTEKNNSPSCDLIFGSWAFDVSRLSIGSKESRVDAAFYQSNNHYELFGTSVKPEVKEYACCPGIGYGSVKFTISLRERRKEKKVDPALSTASTPCVSLATAAIIAINMVLAKAL